MKKEDIKITTDETTAKADIDTNIEAVESDTSASKNTRAKKATTKSASKTVDDLKPGDRVSIDNLSDWDVSFVSEENQKDILISGGVKDYKRLTLSEVDAQVKTDNVAFCGTDGMGSHAIFRINDPVVREYVFGEDVNPVQLTVESVKKMLDAPDRKSFNEMLSELVETDSEKKMVVRICNVIGVDDVESYRINAIEKASGIKFS